MKSDWSSLCWQCKFKVNCVLLASISGILLLTVGIVVGCVAPHAHRYAIGLSIAGIVLLTSFVLCCYFG